MKLDNEQAFKQLEHIVDMLSDIEGRFYPSAKSDDLTHLKDSTHELAYYNIEWVADHSYPTMSRAVHAMFKATAVRNGMSGLDYIKGLSACGIRDFIYNVELVVHNNSTGRKAMFMKIR